MVLDSFRVIDEDAVYIAREDGVTTRAAALQLPVLVDGIGVAGGLTVESLLEIRLEEVEVKLFAGRGQLSGAAHFRGGSASGADGLYIVRVLRAHG